MKLKNISLPKADQRSLDLFRIGLALILIADLVINKWPFALRFYSDQGVLPFESVLEMTQKNEDLWLREWTLMKYFESITAIKIFFSVTLCVYISLLIGFRSRLSSIVAFILLWSIHQKNWLVLSGPDEIIINLLFLSIFLPLGHRFGIEKSTRDKNQLLTPSTFAIFFFVGMTYFFNAWLKNGEIWQKGDALSYALMEHLWTKPQAAWLLQYEDLCLFLTHSTKWIEYSIPVLIFFPWKNYWTRGLAIFFLLGLHWTIFIFLDLGLFPAIVPVYCILLIPTEFWETSPLKYLERLHHISLVPRAKSILTKTNWKRICLIFFIIYLPFITHKSYLNNTKLKNPFYPEFYKELGHSSLFKQYWGFYSPDPSVTHGWYRLAGRTYSNEWIDLKSSEPFISKDSIDISIYQEYTPNVLLYQTIFYGSNRNVVAKWPKAELIQWNKDHPKKKVNKVDLYIYYQTIQAPGKQSIPQHRIVASYSE